MNTSYLNAIHYRNLILRAFAETTQYQKWSDDFARKECMEAKQAVPCESVNPKDFSKEEAESLGFQRWSKDSNLMLIPMWLLPALNQDVEVESISGDIKKVKDIDNDNRRGLLAFGVQIA